MATNPRYKNGTLRRKHRARFKAMGAPCGICGGRRGPIHYDEPSDSKHPLSFVIDEIKPISRWREFGYASPAAAAGDPENTAPAHWVCNQVKGASVGPGKTAGACPGKKIARRDGEGGRPGRRPPGEGPLPGLVGAPERAAPKYPRGKKPRGPKE